MGIRIKVQFWCVTTWMCRDTDYDADVFVPTVYAYNISPVEVDTPEIPEPIMFSHTFTEMFVMFRTYYATEAEARKDLAEIKQSRGL